jgi:hypothetical protein
VRWPVSGVPYGMVPWEGGIFIFLEKIQEYHMVRYPWEGGVFLDEIQEYRMVLYPWEGGVSREKVKKVKAHPFQMKQSLQS